MEDFEPQPVEVWPENVEAFDLFRRMQTQWLYAGGGMGPPVEVGLNYLVLFAFMDRMDLSRDEFEDLLADVQVLEASGLEAKRENL